MFFTFEDMKQIIKDNLQESAEVLQDFIQHPENIEAIERAAGILIETVMNGGKIISCGNGGSMTDAMHFAEELSGVFREKRKALPALSISDPSHITCAANDYGFESIFSRFVEGLGTGRDVLLAISTSGTSESVNRAVRTAREMGVTTIGLTGRDGGDLAGLVDMALIIPSDDTQRIQEAHIAVGHIVCDLIERELFS